MRSEKHNTDVQQSRQSHSYSYHIIAKLLTFCFYYYLLLIYLHHQTRTQTLVIGIVCGYQ